MTVPQLAALLAASACFASYGWGLLRFFAEPGRAPGTALVKWTTAISIAANIAALVFFYRHDDIRFTVAMALYGLSLWLFWRAVAVNRARPLSLAYSTDAPGHLVSAGPYARIRHPLYVSYMLCWIAGMLAAGRPALLATVLVMGWLYHRAALAEEAKFAASPLAADYARYAARAGRYLPRIFRR